MPANGAGEHNFLQVAALLNHVLDSVAMGNAGYVLLDDRSFVEGGGDVMAGGADQLDAALKSLMVGLGADKSGKEGMMDIDHAQQIMPDKFRTEDLHVAREDDQVQIVAQEIEHFPLGFALVFGVGQQMKRDLVKVGQRLGRGVIADDHDDIAGKLAGALAVKQVGKAMIVGGNQDGYLGAVIGERKVILDHETLGHGLKLVVEVGDGYIEALEIPL